MVLRTALVLLGDLEVLLEVEGFLEVVVVVLVLVGVCVVTLLVIGGLDVTLTVIGGGLDVTLLVIGGPDVTVFVIGGGLDEEFGEVILVVRLVFLMVVDGFSLVVVVFVPGMAVLLAGEVSLDVEGGGALELELVVEVL